MNSKSGIIQVLIATFGVVLFAIGVGLFNAL